MNESRSLSKENIQQNVLRLCSSCFQPISQGCTHHCGAKEELNNIKTLLGPDKMEKLCHSYLQEKAGSSGDSHLSFVGNSGGKAMKVEINPKAVKPKKVFGLQQTLAMRTEGNFTSK